MIIVLNNCRESRGEPQAEALYALGDQHSSHGVSDRKPKRTINCYWLLKADWLQDPDKPRDKGSCRQLIILQELQLWNPESILSIGLTDRTHSVILSGALNSEWVWAFREGRRVHWFITTLSVGTASWTDPQSITDLTQRQRQPCPLTFTPTANLESPVNPTG